MAEQLQISGANRAEKYRSLIPQIKSLTAGEPDVVANCANIVAALRQTFGFFWIGIYFVKGEELVLGPFQGDVACTRIAIGKGVCGTAWATAKTVVVGDVEKFPGHIACSALSKSEIVVPVIKSGEVRCVIDIDSDQLNDFGATDVQYLEEIAQHLSKLIS